jgi:hypothetical protein
MHVKTSEYGTRKEEPYNDIFTSLEERIQKEKSPLMILKESWLKQHNYDPKKLPKAWNGKQLTWGRVMSRLKYLFEECGENLGDAIYMIEVKNWQP